MSSTGAHDPERRRYPRVKAKVPVELKCTDATPMRTGTEEISLGDGYIETIFTMEVGTRLSLALSLKDDVIRCMGVVATKYPQVGNGIDFIDMVPNGRLKLSAYIAQHNVDESGN